MSKLINLVRAFYDAHSSVTVRGNDPFMYKICNSAATFFVCLSRVVKPLAAQALSKFPPGANQVSLYYHYCRVLCMK